MVERSDWSWIGIGYTVGDGVSTTVLSRTNSLRIAFDRDMLGLPHWLHRHL